MKQAIYLQKRQLKKELFNRAVAFAVSTPGAMGTPGMIEFVTDQEVYYLDYLNGDVTFEDVCAISEVIDQCHLDVFGEENQLPDGWKSVYLGMGNHLIVRSDIYKELFKRIDRNLPPDEIYTCWRTNVIEIMEGGKRTMTNVVEWIYSESEDQECRFLLGKKGKKMLVCCGVNPSKAHPDELDPTMKRVEALAKNNGYDGYVMINLYPFRETNPEKLPKIKNQVISDVNLEVIKNLFEGFEDEIHIWAAWGTAVETRSYLKECLEEIVSLAKDYHCQWYTIGDLTKEGHPRHPLYLSSDSKIKPFMIE